MKIKVYLRLQECVSNHRRAFVDRCFASHGVAKGPLHYYAVEAASWCGIRRVLKTFDVTGYSQVSAKTVCAYAKDIGYVSPRMYRLVLADVPLVACWDEALAARVEAPELTSFGNQAVEILDPNIQAGIEKRV